MLGSRIEAENIVFNHRTNRKTHLQNAVTHPFCTNLGFVNAISIIVHMYFVGEDEE